MSFDIRNHIEKLKVVKDLPTEYRCICPVCDGNNLTIRKDTGAYQCWSGCDVADIRNEIAPLNPPKSTRPKSDRAWKYTDREGNPLIRTRRIDDGTGKRKIWQEYRIDGRWQKRSTHKTNAARVTAKKAVMPYNYSAAIEAIAKGEPVFWVEGEPSVDALKGIGLTAVTTIGGSAGYSKYGDYSGLFEGASLVICPDRDRPGVKYALAVSKDYPDAQWLYAFPESSAWNHLSKDGGWDIADWIEAMKREGLSVDQIRDRICESIEPKRQLGQSDSKAQTTNHFASSIEDGLHWVTVHVTDEGVRRDRTRIGNHLEAIARVDNTSADQAGIHIEFRDSEKKLRRWTMARGLLAGDGIEILRELLARDYTFARKQKPRLLDYLQTLGEGLTDKFLISDKTGWNDDSFVLPAKTYGNEFLRFREIEPTPETDMTHFQGTLEGWKTGVAAKCEGNSRLIFGLGTAFAAPLLLLVGLESGGFHLAGATSAGKTTTFKVVASVSGLKEIPLWNTTANGLEAIATAFNHLCMPLDEIRQADPKEVGKSAYMLGNGEGKARMRRNLTRSAPKTWQLLFLSAGETAMREYLTQAGVRIVGGQEVRMPDIPAIPEGSAYGVFETIGDYSDPGKFATDLELSARENCGWALDAYLTRLVEARKANPGFDHSLRGRLLEWSDWLLGEERNAVICRVAKRFAVVLLALELAHDYGLLPFPIEQCHWAVRTLFVDWINARGGAGSIEIKQALERIEHLFASNEYSDRVYPITLNTDGTEGEPITPIRGLLAYKKRDELVQEDEFWVPSSVFNTDFATGVDRRCLIQELQQKGWIKGPDSSGKATLQRRVKGKSQRFIVFHPFWRTDSSEDCSTDGDLQKQKNPLPPKMGVTGVTGVTEEQSKDSEEDLAVTPSSHLPKNAGVTGVTEEYKYTSAVTPVTPPSHPRCDTPKTHKTIDNRTSQSAVTPVTPVTPQKRRDPKKGKEQDCSLQKNTTENPDSGNCSTPNLRSEHQGIEERQQSIFEDEGIVPGAICLYQEGRVEVLEVQSEVNVLVEPLEGVWQGQRKIAPRNQLTLLEVGEEVIRDADRF